MASIFALDRPVANCALIEHPVQEQMRGSVVHNDLGKNSGPYFTWGFRSVDLEPFSKCEMPWFSNCNIVDPDIDKPAISHFAVHDGRFTCVSDMGLNSYLAQVSRTSSWAIPAGWMFKAPEELFARDSRAAGDVYAWASTIYSTFTFGPASPCKRHGRGVSDLCPRYRFKQNHLRFLAMFVEVRDRPGWILPTAAKILVNIMPTEDIDTWSGQVEGSAERGMFLSNSVEPV